MFLEVLTEGSQPLLTKWVQVPLESGWGAPHTSESVSTEYDPSFDFQSLRWLSQGKGGRNSTESPDIWILPTPSTVLAPQLRRASRRTKKYSKWHLFYWCKRKENLQIIMRRLLFFKVRGTAHLLAPQGLVVKDCRRRVLKGYWHRSRQYVSSKDQNSSSNASVRASLYFTTSMWTVLLMNWFIHL